MILKTYSRKHPTFQQLIHYIAEERLPQYETDLFFRLHHNVSARSLEQTIADFETNDQYRLPRKNGNACYHTILSFAPLDTHKLTKAMLWNIAQTYIQKRDPQALYFIQPHQDKDHIHLHCCISGNRFASCKATRIPRSDFYQLRIALEQYQQRTYPQLSYSLIYNKMERFEINRLKQAILPLYEQTESSQNFVQKLHEIPSIQYDTETQTIYKGDLSFPIKKLGVDFKLLERMDQIYEIEQQKHAFHTHKIPF